MRSLRRILLCAALAGLTSTTFAQSIPTIKVAFNTPGDEAKLVMRAHPEYFPAIGRDYKIDWLHLQGTATVSQALIAGTADCGITAPLTMAHAIIGAGLQPILIGGIIGESPKSFTSYWVTRADSPIKTVKDLKGKTVAVNTIGSQLDAFTRIWLKQHGLDPKHDVNIAEIPFPLSEAALRQGRVDVIILVQPFASRAEKAGGLRKLGSQREIQPNLLNLIEVCRKDFVDKNPKIAAQYAKDFAAASKRFSDDHAASIALISSVMKLPVPILETFMFTNHDYQRYPNGTIDIADIQKSFDLFFDNGLLAKKLDANSYVRPGVTLVGQPGS